MTRQMGAANFAEAHHLSPRRTFGASYVKYNYDRSELRSAVKDSLMARS
jgi:hypothetical protein